MFWKRKKLSDQPTNQDHDHELEVHSVAADGCMTYHESLNTQTHIMHSAVIKPSINKNL